MRNWTENQVEIVLIRHGATASNREHRYLGKTDEGLDMIGRMELLTLKDAGKYPTVDVLFVSPMKRCVETANILYPGTPCIEIPEWVEMDFGEFERKNNKELSGDERYQAWIDSNGTFPFPRGESREEFVERCVRGLLKMKTYLKDNMDQQSQMKKKTGGMNDNGFLSVGCVVHGGTIMALLSHYLGGEYFDYQIPNGGIYRWVLAGSDPWRSLLAAASDSCNRKFDPQNGTVAARKQTGSDRKETSG